MGYTTEFIGQIEISPPLNISEINFLRKFSRTKRMDREAGPYFIGGSGLLGQGDGPDEVYNHNRPPTGQPGLWCKWTPTEDGHAIEWDGREKFYDSEEWMHYLIEHFLKPGALASNVHDGQFTGFTFNHVLNGIIEAQGEDPDDRWRLIVRDNDVSVQRA